MDSPRQGDVAWVVIVAAAIAYELLADDLLSESTQRACGRHPVLARLAIGAVAREVIPLMKPGGQMLFHDVIRVHEPEVWEPLKARGGVRLVAHQHLPYQPCGGLGLLIA